MKQNLFAMLTVTVLALAVFVTARFYINHCAYEAAVCALSVGAECKSRLRDQIGVFPWVTIQQLDVQKYQTHSTARVRAAVFGEMAIRETVSAVLP
jgi:uncharacterized membrane protein YcgQ (UPF0703/DUF1980 family)